LFFLRYIFPIMWFGGLIGIAIESFFIQHTYEKSIMFIVIPIAMIFLGYFTHKKLIWDLVENVYDCDDHLIIKNRGTTEKILLTNIKNISASTGTNPPQVTLKFVKKNSLGNEITFSPKRPMLIINPFAKNEIVEDLIDRVDRARRK
jgi:hypothetical protein